MQGSRWTLQALRMNGQLGELQIQPDQMQALNPILILVFIPIFEIIIYPLFAKCHLLKKWVYLLMQYYWWAHKSMHRFSSPLYVHIVLSVPTTDTHAPWLSLILCPTLLLAQPGSLFCRNFSENLGGGLDFLRVSKWLIGWNGTCRMKWNIHICNLPSLKLKCVNYHML